jgi:hypothetical protein
LPGLCKPKPWAISVNEHAVVPSPLPVMRTFQPGNIYQLNSAQADPSQAWVVRVLSET